MNQSEQLVFVKKIAENQLWRSTWEAQYEGKKCIAKKIMPDNSEKRVKLAAQLQRQVRMAERINKPEDRKQLVLFHKMIETNEYLAFIRDWVEGKTLEDILTDSQKDIDWKTALKQYIIPIAEILLKAKRYGISHGDLKPANIICASDGISIIDWDTMRIHTQISELTNKTVSISEFGSGTPLYMSPEQCSGSTKGDEKSDVYALGVILYRAITGVTPFENMSSLEMINKKQTVELNNIQFQLAPFHVSDDLRKAIEFALKKDQNIRCGIEEFLDRIQQCIPGEQDSEKTSLPQKTIRNPVSPVQTSTTQGITQKTEQNSIVLIGHTSSGKTVLAAGLYSTSNENFIVTPMDDTTKAFVINVKTNLENNIWPAANLKGDVTQLHFKLSLRGTLGRREAHVEFKEYAGELVSMTNYFHDIIGHPEGVLMLLNPGGNWLKEVRLKNQLVAELKSTIDYLDKLNPRPMVALVITAADRLHGDLKDSADKFEKTVNEIKNTLSLSGLTWKRFEVSVCKQLEKQDKPKLDPQNIHDPFMWLINGKRTKAIQSKVLRYGTYFAIMLLCCLLLRWGYHNIEYNRATGYTAIKDIPSVSDKSDLTNISNCIEALKSIEAQNAGKTFWFTDCKELYNKNQEDFYLRLDETEYTRFVKIIDFPTTREIPNIADWHPKNQKYKEKKTELENKFYDSLVKKIESWADTLCKKKGDAFDNEYDACADFVKKYKQKNNLLDKAFQDHIVSLKTKVLSDNVIDFSSNDPETIGRLIDQCETHLAVIADKTKNEVFKNVVLKQINSIINNEQEELITSAQDLSNKQIDIESIKRPVLECVTKRNKTLFSKDELQKKEKEYKIALKNAVVDKMATAAKDFKEKNRNEAVSDVLDNYRAACLENNSITKSNDVQVFLSKKITDEIDLLISNCRSITDQNSYINMKDLCVKINNNREYLKLIDNKICNFASAYITWYDNNKTLKVQLDSITCSCDYPSGGYIWKINNNEGRQHWYWTGSKYTSSSPLSISFSRNESSLSPWDSYEISVTCCIDNATAHAGFSDEKKTENYSFYFTGKDNVNQTKTIIIYYDGNYYNTVLTFYFTIKGTTFDELIKQEWDNATAY